MIKRIINNNYEINIIENIVDIKHYLKIINISSNKIEILLNNKKISINGNNLVIKCMDEYEIIIKGLVSSIQFINE